MFFPALVILPGLVAIGFPEVSPGFGTPPNFNLALPLMLQRFYPSGLLGIGMTALLASFMSGMAGNVTAFNTVWTYDIYQTHINPGKPDRHYLMMGRVATIVAVVAGVLTAFIVLHFNNLMDYLQALFSIFNAPLFATFLLGMFWKRTTGHGAFWGLLCGLVGSTSHYVLYRTDVIRYYSPMGANFFQAMWAFGIGLVVTVVVTLMTKPRPESELVGLVYSLTPRPELARLPWYQRPGMIALGVLGLCLILNIIFW